MHFTVFSRTTSPLPGRRWRFTVAFLGFAMLAAAPFLIRAQTQEKKSKDDSDQVRFAVPGSVIKGFKAPRFDEKGTLIGLISGHTATITDRTSAKVEGIRYEAYRNSKLDYELEANTCTYDQKEEIVRSTDQLRFKRTGVTLTGDGFQWDIKNMRGTVKSNVVMVIENIENGVSR